MSPRSLPLAPDLRCSLDRCHSIGAALASLAHPDPMSEAPPPHAPSEEADASEDKAAPVRRIELKKWNAVGTHILFTRASPVTTHSI
jgi:hypothetical protein